MSPGTRTAENWRQLAPVGDPAWLPHIYDARRDMLTFVHVRILNADTLLSDKAKVLAGLSNFLGLKLDDAHTNAIAAGPVFNEHAKNRGMAFDTAAQRAQQAEAESLYSEEIDAVSVSARSLAHRCGASLKMSDTLLD